MNGACFYRDAGSISGRRREYPSRPVRAFRTVRTFPYPWVVPHGVFHLLPPALIPPHQNSPVGFSKALDRRLSEVTNRPGGS